MLYIAAMVLLVGFVTIVHAAGGERELNVDAMVEALRQVENWDGHSRGAAGERGPWQITPAVWNQFSDQPFSYAESRAPWCRSETRRVAREYVLWIHRRLSDAKLPAGPFTVALVWTSGWNAYFYHSPHKPTRRKKDYAERARNLYKEIEKVAQSGVPVPTQ